MTELMKLQIRTRVVTVAEIVVDEGAHHPFQSLQTAVVDTAEETVPE
jgi:hypothetical protein